MEEAIRYLPLATTAIAFPFAAAVFAHWRRLGCRHAHLAWWAAGLGLYGAGTLAEGITAITGWHEAVFRWWYITGALLGGAPLAQGTVYLLLRPRAARCLTAVLLMIVAAAAASALATPIAHPPQDTHILRPSLIEWTWVRGWSPFINTYAFVFLVGGAAYSAARYKRVEGSSRKARGIALIAAGAVLPGIGGGFTRAGLTEALYVAELLGLVVILTGYLIDVAAPRRASPSSPAAVRLPASRGTM